jgi:predicted ATP-dependent protease
MSGTLAEMKARITADPDARFAVSLDRLAYAKDNHVLGTDLVRTFVRTVDTEYLPENEAAAVARLRRGMNALTGRAKVLDTRYGDLAVSVRDAGGSVFDWVTDAEARETVQLIAGSNRELVDRIAKRSVA